MSRCPLISGLVFFCLATGSYAGQPPDSLQAFTTRNVWIEKVFLRTDRPHYLAGETISFRIFYVDGFEHQPADLSKVAYVDLISPALAVVRQAKVKMAAGGGAGYLELPYDLPTGSYQLRAYTRWMRNESERLFFHRTVTIINPLEAGAPGPEPGSAITFYPEGGHLVAGTENRVGFYVPLAGPVAGVIQNQKDETVARFSETDNGRGSFLFIPEAQQTYTAIFSVAGNSAIRAPLPAVTAAGVHLRAERVNSQLVVHLFCAPGQTTQLFVLLHQSRMKAKRLAVTVRNGKGTVEYPWAALPPGISRITVFDQHLRPVAERLVFKTPPPAEWVTVTPNTLHAKQRSKIAVSLASVAGDIRGEVAVSVYRLDSVPARAASLHAYLWLESELGAEIEDAGKYLLPSDSSQLLADLLMLTAGWSRYSLPPHASTFAPEIHGALAEGLAADSTGRPAAGAALLASARGRGRIYATRTDHLGKLVFELPDLSGPSTLFIRNGMEPTSPIHIQWHSPFDSRIAFSPILTRVTPAPNALRRAFIHQQVEAVYRAPAEQDPLTSEKPDNPFYGQANETYRLDDYTRFPTMEEVFREYVTGVWVRKNKQGFYFLLLNRLSQTLMDRDNLLLVNGQPISNVNKLMEFNPLEVDHIEVVDRKFFAGPLTLQGIVNVITTPAAAQSHIPDETLLELAYEGYQPYRERAPRLYDSDQARRSRTPDFRHQLYWNPNQRLEAGAANIAFYTSDTTGSFVVVVEGVTNSGRALTGTASFTVER